MDIITTRRTKVEKGYELLADITVGTATTSVDITGLNIGKGDEVLLVSDFIHSIADVPWYYLYVNGNNTNSNYYRQYISASASSIGSSRANESLYSTTSTLSSGANKSLTITPIKVTNSGYVVYQSFNTFGYGGSNIYIENIYVTSTFVASSVTNFRIFSNKSNAIGIGSRFQLYKIN